MYPGVYWKLWSDELLHAIHVRVLRHIKQLSEEGREVFAARDARSISPCALKAQ